MRLIARLLLILSALLVILVLGSFFLPNNQHVERSVEISAPAEKIYPYLANPKLFSQWSPWSKIDPNMKVQYVGETSGKDAGMTWQSEEASVGSGSWTITNAVENESVQMHMDFGDQGLATSSFNLKPADGKTQMTWRFDTEAGLNPIMRWMGLLMDKLVGTEYEKGLLELKEIIEK